MLEKIKLSVPENHDVKGDYTLLDLSKEILSISEEIKVLPWWGQKLSIRN